MLLRPRKTRASQFQVERAKATVATFINGILNVLLEVYVHYATCLTQLQHVEDREMIELLMKAKQEPQFILHIWAKYLRSCCYDS